MSDGMMHEPIELQKVAALHCEGIDNSEIANMLSLARADVQRMIERSEQLGYFDYRPQLNVASLSAEASEFIYNGTLTTALCSALADRPELSFISVDVTPSPGVMFARFCMKAAEGTREYAEYRAAESISLQAVAGRAAERVVKAIFDGRQHTIGVNWGLSVKKVIEKIHLPATQNTIGDMRVISLFGDMEFYPQDPAAQSIGSEYVNCNAHVCELASRLAPYGHAVPLNAPCFVPAEFARNQATFNAIREFLGSHSSYRRIFGELPGDDPIRPRKFNGIIDFSSDVQITQMDTIITGVGSADAYTQMSAFLKFWLDAGELKTLRDYCAQHLVVGDLGCHLIPSVEADENDQLKRFLRQINRRILGAQPSDFVDVASRQRKTRSGAGVVAVAIGARKAKIIARLLTLCNSPCPLSVLVIDSHCALALFKELNAREYQSFINGPGKRFLTNVDEWSADTRAILLP